MVSSIGVIANPMAGKDIRRLVAHASPTSDGAKIGIVRRMVVGAIEGGVTRILLAPDTHRLCERAVDGLDLGSVVVEVLDIAYEGSRIDTIRSAQRMRTEDVGAVVVLGGDGTHRDVAKGWLDAPMVTISTGTNNVFPRNVDATVAGLAAGLVASKAISMGDAADQANVIHAELPEGEHDLALVDIGVVAGSFAGSRAVWDASDLLGVLSCIAEPDTVGLASIGARLFPSHRRESGGVYVVTTKSNAIQIVRAPIAPGAFSDIHVAEARMVNEGELVEVRGPCVLSFDGERDVVLQSSDQASFCIRRDGPRVIDPTRTLNLAAQQHLFSRSTKTSRNSTRTDSRNHRNSHGR
jgi:predicted polyphosphate/ATP-dependent NAD kinase